MRAAVAALTLCATTVTARAETANQYVSKKDRERATKSATHGALPVPGAKPGKLVNLYNEHTHDWLAVDEAASPASDEVNVFLRDHYTNKSMTMDPKLIPIVMAAAKQFKSDVVDVVSGFRHPKYNLMLRKKGHQVARDSQHTHGNAVDFTIPRVSIQKVHEWAKAQKIGGVGIYLTSNFVHMDTGPIRYWSGE